MDRYRTPGTVPKFFNPAAPIHVTRANLPHWEQEGTTYFVTFRLVDSLPQQKLARWRADREQWLDAHPEPLGDEEWAEYHERFSAALEAWLDQAHGSCVLRLPQCRGAVTNALEHFAGERYLLHDLAIAANHVHVLTTPLGDHCLSDILHSWKSFTAKRIVGVPEASRRLVGWWQRLRDRRGQGPSPVCQRPVWQKESYDHIVRSSAALGYITQYIRAHPSWTPT